MLITKSLLVCLREVPQPDVLAATAVVWDTLIGDIPTAELEPCWRKAWGREDRTMGFPVTADELLAVWNRGATLRMRRYLNEGPPNANA